MFSCELFKPSCDQCFIQHYSDLPTTYRGWIQSTIVLYVLLLAVKVLYITVLYTLL